MIFKTPSTDELVSQTEWEKRLQCMYLIKSWQYPQYTIENVPAVKDGIVAGVLTTLRKYLGQKHYLGCGPRTHRVHTENKQLKQVMDLQANTTIFDLQSPNWSPIKAKMNASKVEDVLKNVENPICVVLEIKDINYN